jgi:hypothetical protein
MSASVHKLKLLSSIKDFFSPLLENRAKDSAVVASQENETEITSLYQDMYTNIDWMFRYVADKKTWSHVENLELVNPFDTFIGVDTVATENVSSFLYERAEIYFKQSHFKTSELDWFYLDYVVAVTYRSLLNQYDENDYKTAYPSIYKAIDGYGRSGFFPLLKYVGISLVKNSLIFGISIFLILMALDGNALLSIFGIGLIIWKFYGWYSQRSLFRKLNEKSSFNLSQINYLYKLFADGCVRWDLLEYEIKRLRDLSIDLPLVLDTAVTARKKLV